MTTPGLLFWLLTVAAVAAVAVAVAVNRRWGAAERLALHVGEVWLRWTSVAATVLSGLAAAAAGFVPPESKAVWLWPTIAGAINVGAWQVAQFSFDMFFKRAAAGEKAAREQEARRAEQAVALYSDILAGLDAVVSASLLFVIGELTGTPGKPRRAGIVAARKALDPERRLRDLLEKLARTLRRTLGAPNANVRVGVYLADGTHMRPVHGVSLRQPGYNPFRSFHQHQAAFRLDAADDAAAHVVRCVRRQTTLAVPDGQADPTFLFLHHDQPQYLRSLFFSYLGDVTGRDGKPVRGVLAVDADEPGVFREEARGPIVTCVDHFALRLKLELALMALFDAGGGDDAVS